MWLFLIDWLYGFCYVCFGFVGVSGMVVNLVVFYVVYEYLFCVIEFVGSKFYFLLVWLLLLLLWIILFGIDFGFGLIVSMLWLLRKVSVCVSVICWCNWFSMLWFCGWVFCCSMCWCCGLCILVCIILWLILWLLLLLVLVILLLMIVGFFVISGSYNCV